MSINPYTSAPLNLGHIPVLYTERGFEESILKYITPQHPVEKQNIIIEGEKGIGKTTLITKIQFQLKQEKKRLPLLYSLTQMTNYRWFLTDVLKKSLEFQEKNMASGEEESKLMALLQNDTKLRYVNTGTLESYFVQYTTGDIILIIDNANYILTNMPELKNLIISQGFTMNPILILCFVDNDLTSFMEKDTLGFFDRFGTTLKISKMTYPQVEDMIKKRLAWTDMEDVKLESFLSHDQLQNIYSYFQGFPRGIISVCRNLYDRYLQIGNVTDIDVSKEIVSYQNKVSSRRLARLNDFKKEIVTSIYNADEEIVYRDIFTQITNEEKPKSKANLSIALSELVADGIVIKVDKGIYSLADDIHHLLDEVGNVDKLREYTAHISNEDI
jgi:hypothetical protein